jgi:hypothetical protein
MRPPVRPVNQANLTRVKIASLPAVVTTISVSTTQSFGFETGLSDYPLSGQAATRQRASRTWRGVRYSRQHRPRDNQWRT